MIVIIHRHIVYLLVTGFSVLSNTRVSFLNVDSIRFYSVWELLVQLGFSNSVYPCVLVGCYSL